MLTQFLEQLWAKHHVAIFTSLATLDVNDHALTVDVRNFQVGQLGAPHSGSIERHQQRAMEGSASRIDEARHFFLAHDRSEEHTSDLQSPDHLVCPLLLVKTTTP